LGGVEGGGGQQIRRSTLEKSPEDRAISTSTDRLRGGTTLRIDVTEGDLGGPQKRKGEELAGLQLTKAKTIFNRPRWD